MRRISRIAAIAASLVVSQLFTSAASAVDYTWSPLGGGTAAWDSAANWGGAGFPNAQGDGANLNVALTANLNVNLSADFTLGTLTLGGSDVAVTTDIGNANSTGKGLIFNNSGNTHYIYSRGAVGTSNIISAPVYLYGGETTFTTLSIGNSDVAIDPTAGQRSIVFNGPVQSLSFDRQISNNLRGGATVTYNGDFVLSGGIDTTNPIATGRRIIINGALGTKTIINGKFVAGPLPPASISGSSGSISLGGTQAPPSNIPLADITTPIYELNANNSTFGGALVVNRGRMILNAPNAFGTGEVRHGNPSNEYGFELVAGSADYHIPNLFRFTQSMTARGDNSITFDGVVYQSASRIHTNLLSSGATLTYGNKVFAANTTGDTRNFYIEGPGKTVFAGGLHNVYDGANPLTSPLLNNQGNGGSFIKRGTGTALVTSTASTMRGVVYSHGGLMEFASAGSYGVQADNGEGSPNAGAAFMLTNPGGVIGVGTGSLDTSFLTLFTNDHPGFGTFNDSLGNQVPSRGSIALSSADAASNIDFSSGPLAHDRLRNVSIGALSGGVSYTGTITPDSNTYRLGGGGKLTLPNANQLTGARSLEVRNGGTVALGAANNYNGTTTIQGNWIATTEEYARAGTDNLLQTYVDGGGVNQAERPAKGIYASPTLEVSSVSALGSSSGNVVVRGGVLSYTGSANESTTRNLTIGAIGATLDSSGAGSITFANTGAATLEDQADITSDVSALSNAFTTGNGGSINFGANDPLKVANVGLGWTVTGPGIPVSATINSMSAASSQQSSATTILAWIRNDTSDALANAPGGSTYSFSNQHRTLGLTGSNTGSNTVAAALGDSAKGKLSVNKSGTGTWVLTGNNTYTGATTVWAGTLGVGSANALAGTSGTSVKSGATLAIATPSASAVKLDNAKLTRDSGSKLDLLKGKLVLDYTGASPLAAVKADIISGYAAGTFTGTGITTSDSAAGKKLRVGYAEATQIVTGGTWFGQSVDADAILLAGTFAGDTNLDGVVNFDDLLKVAQNYGLSGKEWVDGDSDYNGLVDFDDLLATAQTYSSSLAAVQTDQFGEAFASDFALAASLVPEPVSLSGLAALAMVAGRRRRA